jgi:hypothetical protein
MRPQYNAAAAETLAAPAGPICMAQPETPMKPINLVLLNLMLLVAAAMAASAMAQDRDAYNLNAATADLAVFHQLARDGALRREDARSDLNFGARFEQADFDRDGVVTTAEMDRYIQQTYGISASSVGSGSADSYRLHAATRDLEAYHQLARGGALRREDAQAHPILGPRFDEADLNRDGVVTAQEMDRYIRRSYGIVSTTAPGGSGSASTGSSAR